MATRKPSRARATKKTAPRKAATPGKAAGKSKATARAKKPARKSAASRPKKAVRSMPESLRLRSVMPGLTCDDLARSLAFYTGALGFVEGDRWTHADGRLLGVMLKAGRCELGLSQDDWAKGRDRKKGLGISLWLQTAQDVDALAARVKAAGFSLTEEPKDQSWGGRSFSVDDPDGFHLSLGRES